jgi:hypothetical protein
MAHAGETTMPYVRKLLASCLLVVGVSAVAGSAANAGAAPGGDQSMPEAAYAPLDAVAIMLDTNQALLFDETQNKYRTVMVGDLVAGWKVVAIEEGRVLVLHDDQRDALTLVAPPRPMAAVRGPQTVVRVSKNGPVVVACEPAPAAAVAPPPAAPVARATPPAPPEDPSAPHRLSRGDLNRELSDFDRLGQAVDVVQAPNGGFRLVRVDKASWPYRMGLREGDVIRSVAGERLANIEDAARVYARLRQARTFTVEVDRPLPGIVDDGDPPASRLVLNYQVK